jgi:hypothetical protein
MCEKKQRRPIAADRLTIGAAAFAVFTPAAFASPVFVSSCAPDTGYGK